MEKTLSELLNNLPSDTWRSETVSIRKIVNDDDLWYAVAECRIAPEQEDLVNPAGFSIGRAYLAPNDNVPCVICKADGERIGFIVLRRWSDTAPGFNWSYFIDQKFQGMGYGKAAAKLAVKIFKAADPKMPIRLSTEVFNTKAQELYQAVGFIKTDELDGDDLVFIIE